MKLTSNREKTKGLVKSSISTIAFFISTASLLHSKKNIKSKLIISGLSLTSLIINTKKINNENNKVKKKT